MEARELRGLENKPKTYTVNLFLQTCTCPDFDSHRTKCKHIYAAEVALARESGLTVPPPDPEMKSRPTYKQEWSAYNAAQVNEKAKFQLLLYELCQGIEEPRERKDRGRPRLAMADVIFAAAFKVYSTISCRRFSTISRKRTPKTI